MYDNPQHTKLKCCPGSEEKVEPCRGVDNCYFCREEPRTVYEVFNKGGKATIRSVDDPSVVKPLPTAGPLTIRGYRCSDAASIGEPWEMNLENVDFAGIDWLRDGQCWDFASYNPPAANNMVQMYELTIKDMAKFATSKYCEINKGKVTDPDPNCTSGHTFGGAEYHTFNAEGFWALKGTKEMILHSREVYRLGCAMDEIGCPNGSCQATDETLPASLAARAEAKGGAAETVLDKSAGGKGGNNVPAWCQYVPSAYKDVACRGSNPTGCSCKSRDSTKER